jgi:hypothetical protein
VSQSCFFAFFLLAQYSCKPNTIRPISTSALTTISFNYA